MRCGVRDFAATSSLVCALLVASNGSRADSPVYVDPGGVCDGMSPCFTTVQAGVNNATDPDAPLGGAFAQVFVFPGTYNESVDISDMGSAVAGAPGDLRMVTVDAAGLETPGTVLVNPATDKPIENVVVPFPGNVIIDGFTVLTPDDSGIVLDLSGSAEIVNVTADGNANNGMFIGAINVTIQRSTANRNALDGFSLESGLATVTINESVAIRNGRTGFSITNAANTVISASESSDNGTRGFAGTSDAVSISQSEAINNAQRGYSFTADGPVDIIDSIAYVNGEEGFQFSGATTVNIIGSISNVNGVAGFLLAATGDVTVTESVADGNAVDADGFLIETAASVQINDSGANDNGRYGWFVNAAGEVVIADSTADGNLFNGMSVVNVPTAVNISGCSASDNDNIGIVVQSVGDVSVTESMAHGNSAIGVSIQQGEDVLINACHAEANGEHGIVVGVTIAGAVEISHATAIANGRRGIHVDRKDAGPLSISNSVADRNFEEGIAGLSGISETVITSTRASGNGRHGIWLNATRATINGATTGRNDIDGISISNAIGAIEISASSSSGNDGAGFALITGGPHAISIRECTTDQNMASAIFVDAEPGSQVTIERVTVTDTDDDGIHVVECDTVTVMDSRVRGNRGAGIRLAAGVVGALHQLTGNVICQNLSDGLALASMTTVNAEGNWWGDESGPFHEINNAGGLGDRVHDGTNGGSGTVVFDPWIDTVTASVNPASVNVGETADVTFQFSGGGGTVFLGDGPGDPNGDAPFSVSTDNGVLEHPDGNAATIGAFITEPNGVLAARLIPSAAGDATVTLVGPCGLAASTMLTVNEAPEEPEEPEQPEEPENPEDPNDPADPNDLTDPNDGTPQEPPASQPTLSEGMSDCGAGVCGFGTLGVMPMMFAGLCFMRARSRNHGLNQGD